jgi:SynChlorMet cassette radical SAM/SPASM protein ScmE
VTVHRRNVRHLEEIAGFLLDDLHLPEFGTNAASYFGSCRGQREHVMLTVPERQQAMETLLRLAEVYPRRITAAAGPLAEGGMWREMEEARAAGREEMPGRGRLTGCGCTSSKIAVRSDGAYVPCAMLPHLALGRINRDDLLEVWRHSAVLEGMRRRSEIPLRSLEPCRGCEYAPYCTGNCPGTAYTVTGELNQPAPDACLRRFLDAGGRLPQ